MEARLAKIRAKERAQRERYLKGDQKYKKRKMDTAKTDASDNDEEQFILDDYDSDAEQSGSRKGVAAAGSSLSASTIELMEKLGMNINGPKEEEVEAEDEMKACNHVSALLSCLLSRLSPLNLPILISTDILLLTNSLPTNTIHQ